MTYLKLLLLLVDEDRSRNRKFKIRSLRFIEKCRT